MAMRMRTRWLGFLLTVCSVMFLSPGQAGADVIVSLPDLTAQTPVTSMVMGFDVPVSVGSVAEEFVSLGYLASIAIVPQAGATGSVTFASATVASAGALLAAPDSKVFDGDSKIRVQDVVAASAPVVAGDMSLFMLNLTIAPGTVGTFNLEFFDDPTQGDTQIFDELGLPRAGVMFQNGAVTLLPVPEPASLAVLTVAMLWLMRRRRVT